MHHNTKGESPCVANVKNSVRKTLELRSSQLWREITALILVQRRGTVHKRIEVGGGIFENLL
jgi:hypothetical protein